ALDPPALQSPPTRGPRTPGLRRAPDLSPGADRTALPRFLPGPSPPYPGSSPGPLAASAFPFRFLSRTEPGLSRSCRRAFRSPRPSPKSGQADGTSEESLHLDVEKLKEKRDTLDKEISQLISEGYRVDELEEHISQLHEYNDIKDVGQMLLGKLAVIRGVTTKELYPEFNLDVND
ncbi:hypothetical protein GW7_01922, partial [Heterocephalus glaber]